MMPCAGNVYDDKLHDLLPAERSMAFHRAVEGSMVRLKIMASK